MRADRPTFRRPPDFAGGVLRMPRRLLAPRAVSQERGLDLAAGQACAGADPGTGNRWRIPRRPAMTRLPNASPKPRRKSAKQRLREALLRQRRSLQRRARPKSRKVSKRFAALRDKSYVSWIATLPCIALGDGCNGPVQVCHLKSRGAGGADYGNTFPACFRHHTLQHAAGIKTWASAWFAGG